MLRAAENAGLVPQGLRGYVFGPGEGEMLAKQPNGRIDIIKVSPVSGSRNISASIARMLPGSKVPVHRHDRMDEILYFPSGSGIGYLGDKKVELGPGSMIYIPKGVWHGFENPSVPLECLALVAPPGLEASFRTFSGTYAQPREKPLTDAEGTTILVEYGDTYRVGDGFNGLAESKWQTKKPSGPGFAFGRNEGAAFTDRSGRRVILKNDGHPIAGLGMIVIEAPAGAGVPTTRFDAAERIFYVESGEGVSALGDFRFKLEPGSVVYVPTGTWHGIENPDRPMRIAAFYTPPGWEDFFRATLDGARRMTPDEIADLARKHRIVMKQSER